MQIHYPINSKPNNSSFHKTSPYNRLNASRAAPSWRPDDTPRIDAAPVFEQGGALSVGVGIGLPGTGTGTGTGVGEGEGEGVGGGVGDVVGGGDGVGDGDGDGTGTAGLRLGGSSAVSLVRLYKMRLSDAPQACVEFPSQGWRHFL